MAKTIKISDEFHKYLKDKLDGTPKSFEELLIGIINREEELSKSESMKGGENGRTNTNTKEKQC